MTLKISSNWKCKISQYSKYTKSNHNEETKKNHFVGERRPSVDVVELFGKNWHKQNDDAEQHGKPEVGGDHAVECNTLVGVCALEQSRVRHQGHAEVGGDWAPDKQVVDTGPEIRLQAALQTTTGDFTFWMRTTS